MNDSGFGRDKVAQHRRITPVAREMDQQFTALVAFAKNPGLIRAPIEAHNHPQLQFQEILETPGGGTCVVHIHTHKTLIHINNSR